MHIVNFRERSSSDTWRAGVLTRNGVKPLESSTDGDTWAGEEPALTAALAHAEGRAPTPSTKELPLEAVEIGTPVLRPGKIVAAAANYLDHSAEMGSTSIERQGFFLKAPSSLLATGKSVALPIPGRRTDYEGELAAIIGRTASCVDAADALSYVLGYSCVLDVSLRGEEDRGFRKSFDTFTPLGPALVTADEVGDLNDKVLRTTINGAIRQEAKLSTMIVDVASLVSWVSSVMTLLPGDVIATGTPSGVGPLSPGDRVEVEVGGVGILSVDVVSRNTPVLFPSARGR